MRKDRKRIAALLLCLMLLISLPPASTAWALDDTDPKKNEQSIDNGKTDGDGKTDGTAPITTKQDVTDQYTITPVAGTLTIKTASAKKTYDGKPLTKTDGYTLDGLQNGETVTFKVTGSQTEVGSSKNSFTLTWDGTAKQSNYAVKTELGTLTVSGGPLTGDASDPILWGALCLLSAACLAALLPRRRRGGGAALSGRNERTAPRSGGVSLFQRELTFYPFCYRTGGTACAVIVSNKSFEGEIGMFCFIPIENERHPAPLTGAGHLVR